MKTPFYILLAVSLVGSVSLIGVMTLGLAREQLKKATLILVSFATGSLFGSAFLHLIPETYEHLGINSSSSLLIISGFLAFFILEKILRWRHCHLDSADHVHPFVFVNLVGDGMHNFIDGMLIASTFMVDTRVGLATTLAVLLHEIPQEIGDFAILLHGGLTVRKALFYNFLSALTAIVGALFMMASHLVMKDIGIYMLPVTAGGFLYIAGSDLIPELHHENNIGKSLWQLVMIVFGILLMMVVGIYLPHGN